MFWHAHHVSGLASLIRVWFYAVYPLIKLLAYVAWCHWGAAFLDVKPGRSAFKDGGIRFAIGLAFGGAVYLIAGALGAETISWFTTGWAGARPISRSSRRFAGWNGGSWST